MKSLSAEQRMIFAITNANEKSVTEAKFKLAGLHFGYGKFDCTHYWSLPPENSSQGYHVLKSLFNNIRRI